MSLILPIKDKFVRAIAHQAGFIQDIEKRIRIESDLQTYNPKEDLYIWSQKRGEVPNYYSVYFDDVFIVGFEDTELPEATFLRFFRALHELALKKEVVLDKFEKQADDIIKSEISKIKLRDDKKRIDDLPESTKEQRMAKEAIRRVNRRVSAPRQH